MYWLRSSVGACLLSLASYDPRSAPPQRAERGPSRSERLDSLGFRAEVARSTLAEANESRDWGIGADWAQKLMVKARRLETNEELGLELEATVSAFDSTTSDRGLSWFLWAQFRKRKGAIKRHTLPDLRGPIPTIIEIPEGKGPDVNL